ncbi:MAG: hypothetical protein HW416_385 [Chloroflexi bacterium]|nr:hypothetical protein [Chloroflexota bacterium]
MMQALLALVPPWVMLAALVGCMHGALFHLLFGNRVGRLPIEILIGLVASVAGGLLGTMIPPAVLAIGDTNLISSAALAWLALGIARLFRFC